MRSDCLMRAPAGGEAHDAAAAPRPAFVVRHHDERGALLAFI
jgi:hypothetical protein